MIITDLPSMTAYEKNGLKIVFQLERLPDNPNTTVITMSATNETLNPMSEFLFQVAVPKVSYISVEYTVSLEKVITFPLKKEKQKKEVFSIEFNCPFVIFSKYVSISADVQ